MDLSSAATRLLALLDQEAEQASALLAALRDEHEALQQRVPSAIDSALESKTQRLKVFERTENERRRLLTTLQVPDNREAIGAYLAKQAEHGPALARQWSHLLAIAEQCHHQNQLNGALVEMQRRHVQRALDILRGTPENATYGPRGTTEPRSGSHTLAKA